MSRRQEAIKSIKAEMRSILSKKLELENSLSKLQEQIQFLERERETESSEKIEDLLTFRD
jgi:chromosome segregation ATPase